MRNLIFIVPVGAILFIAGLTIGHVGATSAEEAFRQERDRAVAAATPTEATMFGCSYGAAEEGGAK